MMTPCTPGPWIVDTRDKYQLQIRDEAGEIIIATVPIKFNPDRARADAQILAAAWEMRDLLARLTSGDDAVSREWLQARALLARIDGASR